MKIKAGLLFVSLMALMSPCSVFAGQGNGKVEIEHVGGWDGNTIVFFYTENHTNKPACNIYRGRWALDLSTELGKSQYSLLLTAQAAGRSVVVGGIGSCSLLDDSETVHWVGFPVNYSLHP